MATTTKRTSRTTRSRSASAGRAGGASAGRTRSRTSNGGSYLDMAREHPFTAAAAAGAVGAIAASAFLWSKRDAIGEQINQWTDALTSRGEQEDEPELAAAATRGRTTAGRSRRAIGMSETGAGNTALGAHSGGGGMSAGTSGRERVRART